MCRARWTFLFYLEILAILVVTVFIMRTSTILSSKAAIAIVIKTFEGMAVITFHMTLKNRLREKFLTTNIAKTSDFFLYSLMPFFNMIEKIVICAEMSTTNSTSKVWLFWVIPYKMYSQRSWADIFFPTNVTWSVIFLVLWIHVSLKTEFFICPIVAQVANINLRRRQSAVFWYLKKIKGPFYN